jgi:hypothetical protein
MLGSLTSHPDKRWFPRAVWEDPAVRWRRAHIVLLAALTLFILGAAPWVVGAATTSDGSPVDLLAARAGAAPAGPAIPAVVAATPAAAPLPAGFLGLSFEYGALAAYTGGNPAALNPVFVRLLRNLAPGPGQRLVLRIGGNSTDATWWPLGRTARPAGARYALTPRWLAGARALATTLRARLIVGVNLAAGSPRLAAAEARALLRGIGPARVAAIELGNEPDVYGLFPWYTGRNGPVYARTANYGLDAYLRQITRWAAALPRVPLAGPATAELPWMAALPALRGAAPGLRIATVHRYALQGCETNSGSPAFPSIENLLSDHAAAGLAQALVPYVVLAHAEGLRFRVDELNSAALAGCLGRAGVSDTFASALWMLDALFNLAGVGVDGVNVHSLPGAAYAPFAFRHTPGGWQGSVRPDYYGMLMFAQAFPSGARLLPVDAAPGPVKVWATRAHDGRIRVVMINKDSRAHEVELRVAAPRATVEWLRAPSADATGGVTLGGRSVLATGVLPAPHLQAVTPRAGRYWIELPPASAALLTG